MSRNVLGKAAYGLLLALGVVCFGFPLYWMVRGALIDQATWTQVPLVWAPPLGKVTLDAFMDIFESTQFRMGRVLFNTFLLASVTMGCNVLFDCMAGFALAKMRVPGKGYVLIGLLVTLMVPFEGLMVPLYLVITKLGLANTFPGIRMSMVYGVTMPGGDGRAGMATIISDTTPETFDFKELLEHFQKALPPYAVPKFIRFRTEFESTSTHKFKKFESKKEGFDPNAIGDPLFVLLPGKSACTPLNTRLYKEIMQNKYRF